jgi:hypothetical protein
MWTYAKKFLKSPTGIVGIILSTSPFWKPFYNIIDAVGNLQFIVESLPAIQTFLGSTLGTYSVMAVGFGLLALQGFKQKHKILPSEPDVKLIEPSAIPESKVESQECPYSWLHKIAAPQAMRIQQYVELEAILIGEKALSKPIPYIVFCLKIINKSLFDVVIEMERSIDSYIVFRDQQLAGQLILRFNGYDSPVSHLRVSGITLEQRLSREEADFIASSENTESASFFLDRLTFTIKGASYFPQVNPQRLIINKRVKVDGTEPN